MQYSQVRLEAFGYSLPEHVVSSADLERQLAVVYEKLNLHEGRLEMMTGIRERRFWSNGTLPSDASTRAGRQALDAAGVPPEDVECLIHTSVSRDFLEPATASVVHHHLGLSPRAVVYDISNACLGFVNGMITLANMIELGQVRRGLIVAGESSRQLVESTIHDLVNDPHVTRQKLKRAFSSLTIGSGAVALVMSHATLSVTGHRLLGGVVRTSTEDHNLCRGTADTGFAPNASMLMNTDAETLLNSGCALAADTWQDFRKVLGWSADDVDRSYGHQVGATHRDRLYEALGLDPAKDYSTFDSLGNVGSVSLPLTMAMGLERDPPSAPARVAMLGIGSGLNCIMLGAEWQPSRSRAADA
ncbi:MAG: 3-oxoacyl-ACP synthase III [bacterium]|nr:3-oxoacyl-ACP synthase III [bacterium]